MSSLEDVGSPVDFEFVVRKKMVLCLCSGAFFCVCCNSLCSLPKVTNPGQALQTLGSAFLNIMWPYELSNGKWLLYPASLNFDGSADTRCTLSGALNPLRLHSSSPAGITSVSHQVGLRSVPLKLNVRPRQWLSTAVTRRCVSLNVLLQQAGRARRSHPEDLGHVTTKGSVGRTTPAVAASDRRKSLKLVRGSDRKRRGKCICLVAHWSSSPPGLSSRVGPLHPVSVSSPQLLWTGCPEDPCQAVEQQLHRGGKHVFIFLSEPNAAECQIIKRL